MFDGYEPKIIRPRTDVEIFIDIRPGWRLVSTRKRIGWHKIKHKHPMGVVTECGLNGYVTIPALDPARIHPCLDCLETDNDQ
jgi:hypothetical protein